MIGSSAPNGSSISSTGGSAASARASPTRWRCPPESCGGIARARRRPRGSTSSSSSATRARDARLRPAEQPRHGARCCRRPSCAGRGRSAGSRSRSRAAARRAAGRGRCGRRSGCRPRRTAISRLTIFSAVVLPPPDGPTSTQNVPGRDLEREVVERAPLAPGVALRRRGRRRSPAASSCALIARFRIPARPIDAAGADEQSA